MNITYIYTYAHIYIRVCAYVYMYWTLSSVFDYRMWLPNSVVPVGWQQLSQMNTFFLLNRVLSLNGFPVDDLKYLPCQTMQPIILGSLQNWMLIRSTWVAGCLFWPLDAGAGCWKLCHCQQMHLFLALIIYKKKGAIKFFLRFILKLVLLVFDRTKQYILSATRMCTKIKKIDEFHNLNLNFVQYFRFMHVYLSKCKISEFLMVWSLG